MTPEQFTKPDSVSLISVTLIPHPSKGLVSNVTVYVPHRHCVWCAWTYVCGSWNLSLMGFTLPNCSVGIVNFHFIIGPVALMWKQELNALLPWLSFCLSLSLCHFKRSLWGYKNQLSILQPMYGLALLIRELVLCCIAISRMPCTQVTEVSNLNGTLED